MCVCNAYFVIGLFVIGLM